MRKALFIYNPVAGRKQLRVYLEKIINILSTEYCLTIRETQGAGDATEIVRENSEKGYDAIICCGGDGTLNEVIHGMLTCGMTTPLGYIPCGSTNDFARSLHIPTNSIAAANNILRDDVAPIDIGSFNNERHFSYIASFGALTEASYNTPQKEKNTLGHLAYILRGSKDFFALKNCPVYKAEIRLSDGSSVQGEYFFGSVCNSTSVAGLVRLAATNVDFQDGLFELILVKKPKTRKEWFALLDDILWQRIERNPLVEMRQVASAEIIIQGEVNWTLDGEMATTEGTVKITNQKCSINLFR